MPPGAPANDHEDAPARGRTGFVGQDDDDARTITLRVPRLGPGLLLALIAHGLFGLFVAQLPTPKKKPTPIQVTMRTPPPEPPAMSPLPPPRPQPPPPAKKPTKKTTSSPPPQTSPVLPVLPPSEKPPENRAILPVAEKSAEPAPPPAPSGWRDRLMQSLAVKTPPVPSGVLTQSVASLAQVVNNDPRMHDDENERRLQENHGPFFRRGIEALRRTWHPDDALRTLDRGDPTRLCGRKTRTTKAVAIINTEGTVVDVEIVDESGCAALDTEAVAAFKRVAQFPYPPKGLFVNPDGTPALTARYPVRFIVSFDGGLRLDWN
jgi:TonB family protein